MCAQARGCSGQELVHAMIPQLFEKAADRPQRFDPSHGWPRGLPKETWSVEACVWMRHRVAKIRRRRGRTEGLKGRGNGIIGRGVVIYSKATNSSRRCTSTRRSFLGPPVMGCASNRLDALTGSSAGDTQTFWASGDGLGGLRRRLIGWGCGVVVRHGNSARFVAFRHLMLGNYRA